MVKRLKNLQAGLTPKRRLWTAISLIAAALSGGALASSETSLSALIAPAATFLAHTLLPVAS
ncbi:hypothetical protein CSV86_007180 [Pseudomonas putida CSV86]|uniref:Uncharacterized protein n=1 Tax=Pseudomonas bharatica CSV86 TaxID=1005395 RepID=L1M1V4_9PSED|nr:MULTISPECIES: hypothetical protein [Pseudomonas]MDG9882291.1 hypothetical protein [Pseudomonas sp. GD04058]NNJ15037.1 hypothetical protein [Pseudomonas bharatica CSV86]